jgi:hypothetical protein
LVDRSNGHYVALKLPEYDPAVSQVSWYRDYAAYCGISSSGKQLYAVVAQLGAHKPLVSKKLGPWLSRASGTTDTHTPACLAAAWQRDPLRVTFQQTGDASVSFDLVGLSAVLVEDGDGDEPTAAGKSASQGATGPSR